MIPIFITALYSIVSMLYVVTLVYLQQNNGISMKNAVIWLIIYCAILTGIFLGIPSTYDSDISSAEEDYTKHQDETTISGQLKGLWVDAVSSKNKYFLSWFIALLYIPIIFHYIYRCTINPMMYSFITSLFKRTVVPGDIRTSGVINILNEIDKLQIKYTSEEEKLFKTIRNAAKEKKEIILESQDIEILKKLRYHIENKKLWNRLKNMSSSLASTSVVPKLDSTLLYIINVIIIAIVGFYMVIYDYSQTYLMIPLFSCMISLAVYYLRA
jgi:hypothetical protein